MKKEEIKIERNYLTVDEFQQIRKIENLSEDFLDFLEIGFRTGISVGDILHLKKENIDLEKKIIIGTARKTGHPIYIVMDSTTFQILKKRVEQTKTDLLFSDQEHKVYPISYFSVPLQNALKMIHHEKCVHKPVHSIRAGNAEFLRIHKIPLNEIMFRQDCFIKDQCIMKDQSASVYAIDTYL